MRTVNVGDEDLSAAVVSDVTIRSVNECGNRETKKDRNSKSFHAFGALTVAKRAFLIRSFRFLPSVDIRYIESSFSPASPLRKRMLSLSSQTPSQPNSFF